MVLAARTNEGARAREMMFDVKGAVQDHYTQEQIDVWNQFAKTKIEMHCCASKYPEALSWKGVLTKPVKHISSTV